MEQKTSHSYFIWSAVILGVSIVLGTGIVAYDMYKVKALSNTIEVTGSAQKEIASDVVKWRSNFSRIVGPNELKTGYAEMKDDLDKVTKFLRDSGVKDEEITVQPVSMNHIYNSGSGSYLGKPEYGGGGTLQGYNLMQNITVESNEVDKITKVAQDSSSLINQGIVFSSNGLEYYYSKLADLKVEMLGEATKNAAERAKQIVESAGSKIGGLRSANMGVLQITPTNSPDVSDYGYYDTSSIQKQITAIVHASFSVQ